MSGMTEAQIIALLEAIEQAALVPYPFADDAPRVDPKLVFALGEIAGTCSRVLAGRRPLRVRRS